MSEQSEQAEPAPEQAEAPQENGVAPEWLGPIEARMEELRDQNYALAEQFQNLLTYPDEETYEDEAEYEDEQGNLTPEGAQMIIDQRVDALLSERMGEIDARQALGHRDESYDLLREQIPALQDDQVAVPIIQELAAELESAGFGAVIRTPIFVDLIEQRYKAYQFDERASSEQVSQPGVILESAGGAAPQQREAEIDWAARVAKAAERANPRI